MTTNTTSNSSDWHTASGAVESNGTNLANANRRIEPQIVVGSGGLEINGTGPVRYDTPVSHTTGEEVNADGTIMGTVKASHGGQLVGRVPNGNDLVSVGGMPTTINAAVAAGFLVRNQDGSFSDKEAPLELKDPTAKGSTSTQVSEQKAKLEDSGVNFGEEAEAELQGLLAAQDPSSLYRTVDTILQTGDMDHRVIERMASKAGVEPSEMAEKVETVWVGVYDSAMDIMADAGMTNEESFEAFLNDNPLLREDMKEAARNFFIHNQVGGLEAMAEEYLVQADKYDTETMKELLTDAGYEYLDNPQGGLRVLVNGTPISWEVAVKQKIITFSTE